MQELLNIEKLKRAHPLLHTVRLEIVATIVAICQKERDTIKNLLLLIMITWELDL